MKYLLFVSFLDAEMVLAVEIFAIKEDQNQSFHYNQYEMTWHCKESGLSHTWYWPSFEVSHWPDRI